MRSALTTDFAPPPYARHMGRPRKPHHESRIRLHYVNEWAERRDMKQAQIAEALAVEKSTVSRWFDGALPSEAMLPRIAAMFGIELDELFRAPDDNWLRRFLEGRSSEEIQRIEQTLKAAFPKKIA